MLICAGFLLIYLIEELVHVTCDRYAQHDHCEEDHSQTIKAHRLYLLIWAQYFDIIKIVLLIDFFQDFFYTTD